MPQELRPKEIILTSDNTEESWSAAVWDPRNGSQLSVFKNAGALVPGTLQLLSDSYVIGASCKKPRINIWALNNPSPLSNVRLTTPGLVNALTCASNGSYIIAAVDKTLFIWQTCNGRLLGNIERHYQIIRHLSTTKDGSLFASGGDDGLVFVWSLYNVINNERPSPVHEFSNHNLPITGLFFGHGDSRARLYTISLDRTANVYELGSGTLLVSLVFDTPLTAVTVNIRESELFIGCITGDIMQCNLHEPPREIKHHVTVNVNDAAEEKAVFKGHKIKVTVLSVSMDCRTLLSGSMDKEVHIWDIVSRQQLRSIRHNGIITAAFFAPGYENFRASTLKPRLEICSLQKTSDDGKESVIKIISRGRNPMKILDFESYVQNNDSRRPDEKLQEMKEEIEKLRKINFELYRYSITHILSDKGENQQKIL